MSLMKTSDLRKLDVIDLQTGSYLGNVCDLDLDPKTGLINYLVVDFYRPFAFWFNRRSEIEVPWEDVSLVGNDVILIKKGKWQR